MKTPRTDAKHGVILLKYVVDLHIDVVSDDTKRKFKVPKS